MAISSGHLLIASLSGFSLFHYLLKRACLPQSTAQPVNTELVFMSSCHPVPSTLPHSSSSEAITHLSRLIKKVANLRKQYPSRPSSLGFGDLPVLLMTVQFLARHPDFFQYRIPSLALSQIMSPCFLPKFSNILQTEQFGCFFFPIADKFACRDPRHSAVSY